MGWQGLSKVQGTCPSVHKTSLFPTPQMLHSLLALEQDRCLQDPEQVPSQLKLTKAVIVSSSSKTGGKETGMPQTKADMVFKVWTLELFEKRLAFWLHNILSIYGIKWKRNLIPSLKDNSSDYIEFRDFFWRSHSFCTIQGFLENSSLAESVLIMPQKWSYWDKY